MHPTHRRLWQHSTGANEPGRVKSVNAGVVGCSIQDPSASAAVLPAFAAQASASVHGNSETALATLMAAVGLPSAVARATHVPVPDEASGLSA